MSITAVTTEKLPGRFADLAALMPPQALLEERQYEQTIAMIDRLMARRKLTKGQELYLETLVQLVEAYEQQHHRIGTDDLSGVELLKSLLAERGMNASELARVLGVHASMGSKILNGERSLTLEHLKKLAKEFCVRADFFIG